MTAERIISFLPSATEMVYALGLGDRLMGVSHECDYPPEARAKPFVVSPILPLERMSQREIDEAVSERLRNGQSLYQVNETLVQTIAPDLILTQDLCQVCAPSGNEVAKLLQRLAAKPQILWLTAKSLEEIFDNIGEVGAATGKVEQAQALVARAKDRLAEIAAKTAGLVRPRVFCMEWIDPVYCSGHWVPEMVRIAGGEDRLGRAGTDSVRVSWDRVRDWAPEILIVMPCGFNCQKAVELAQGLAALPGWFDLPAVRQARVYAVDASSYFARPGPRVVQGTELLAHLLHIDHFAWDGPQDVFRTIALRAPERKPIAISP
jgi:iron complex transport system substrate-binding protein